MSFSTGLGGLGFESGCVVDLCGFVRLFSIRVRVVYRVVFWFEEFVIFDLVFDFLEI